MQFGIFVPQGWRLDLVGIPPEEQWPTMRDFARRITRPLDIPQFGSTTISTPSPVPTDEATHEAWSLMAAFAAATERLRLGQMCTCIGYRSPVYLAKVAATCDVHLRWAYRDGHRRRLVRARVAAYGYGFPGAGTRLAMLDEGVQILRQAWTEGVATLDGVHYQVDGAICRPLPLQDGGIPLWIAGGGEKKTLRIAAKYAQYTNFDATPETFKHKSEILEQHCRDLGRDFGEIVRSGNYNVVIGETEGDVHDKLEWIIAHYKPLVPADQLERYRHMFATGPLVGTPEQLVERLHEAEQMGMTYAIGNFADAAYDPTSMDLFANAVAAEFA